MKLIDSSVWINYIRGVKNPQTDFLHASILEGGIQICTCPTIIQEVLQGFRGDEAYQKFKKMFLQLDILLIPEPTASIQAADMFRTLRKKGLTVRKMNDCNIAQCAMAFDLELVHNDLDFQLIQKVFPLKTF